MSIRLRGRRETHDLSVSTSATTSVTESVSASGSTSKRSRSASGRRRSERFTGGDGSRPTAAVSALCVEPNPLHLVDEFTSSQELPRARRRDAIKDFFRPASSKQQAILEAVREPNVEFLRQRLAATDVNQHMKMSTGCGGSTLLVEAAKAGHVSVIKLLVLEARADINGRDVQSRTPLLWAASAGRLSAIAALLRLGADPLLACHRSGNTVVHELVVACDCPDVDAFQLLCVLTGLLRQCPGVQNVRNLAGETPAHLACRAGSYEVLTLLTKFAVTDLTLLAADGADLLMYAVRRQDVDLLLVKYLLSLSDHWDVDAALMHLRKQRTHSGNRNAVLAHLVSQSLHYSSLYSSSSSSSSSSPRLASFFLQSREQSLFAVRKLHTSLHEVYQHDRALRAILPCVFEGKEPLTVQLFLNADLLGFCQPDNVSLRQEVPFADVRAIELWHNIHESRLAVFTDDRLFVFSAIFKSRSVRRQLVQVWRSALGLRSRACARSASALPSAHTALPPSNQSLSDPISYQLSDQSNQLEVNQSEVNQLSDDKQSEVNQLSDDKQSEVNQLSDDKQLEVNQLSDDKQSEVNQSKQSVASQSPDQLQSTRPPPLPPRRASVSSGDKNVDDCLALLADRQRQFEAALCSGADGFDELGFPLAVEQRALAQRRTAERDAAWAQQMDSADAFDCRNDGHRQLVFLHGVPPGYRAQLWSDWAKLAKKRRRALPGYFGQLMTRARAGQHDGATPFHQIEIDLDRTFPQHPLFGGSAVGKAILRDTLIAYSLRNSLHGYCQSMNFVAGFLLVALRGRVDEAFWLLCKLTEEILPDYWNLKLDGIQIDQEYFAHLLQAALPELWRAWQAADVAWDEYQFQLTFKWFLTLYAFGGQFVPSATLAWIWDQLLLDGPAVLFDVGLALLQLAEPALARITSGAEISAVVAAVAASLHDPSQLAAAVLRARAALAAAVTQPRWRFYDRGLPPPCATRLPPSAAAGPRVPARTSTAGELRALCSQFASLLPGRLKPTVDVDGFRQIARIVGASHNSVIPAQSDVDAYFRLLDLDADQLINAETLMLGMSLFFFSHTSLAAHVRFICDLFAPATRATRQLVCTVLAAVVYQSPLYLAQDSAAYAAVKPERELSPEKFLAYLNRHFPRVVRFMHISVC